MWCPTETGTAALAANCTEPKQVQESAPRPRRKTAEVERRAIICLRSELRESPSPKVGPIGDFAAKIRTAAVVVADRW